MGAVTATFVAIAVIGAAGAWLAAAYFFLQVVRHRGSVSGFELAVSFMTAIRKLPPEAAPHMRRLSMAFAAFFVFVFVGVIAGITASR